MTKKNIRKTINNSFVKYSLTTSFPDIYDYESFNIYIERNIEDILRGASGQLSSTKRPSTYRIFQILITLDEINFNTVSEKINSKQMVLSGDTYSESYIRQWVSCLTCASQGIYHHLLTNNSNSPK